MPTILEGSHHAPEDARFAVVVSRFNDTITERLLEGALGTLRRSGADVDHVTVAWCPGAYELPLVAKKLAESSEFDAVIALGAVIRGATYHFELVASGAASGVTQTSLETDVPVIFGVITTETIEQALERSGTKAGNKGCEAARAAIEMVTLLREIG